MEEVSDVSFVHRDGRLARFGRGDLRWRWANGVALEAADTPEPTWVICFE